MRTFKDLNLNFDFDEEIICNTCRDGSCHNIATCTKDNVEYSVHISTNPDFTDINVSAVTTSNTESGDDIDEYFTNENDAVEFICKTFTDFKCF